MRDDLMKASRASLARALDKPAKTKKLDLNNAHLDEFPVGILACKHLESLGMFRAIAPKIVRDKGNITLAPHVIPSGLGTLRALRELELGGLCMRALPESLCSLPLRSLSLNYCEQLEKLPKALGKLGKLEELTLGYTSELRELPAAIGDLKSLRVLSAGQSGLSRVPSTITKLTKLRALHLPRSVEVLPKGMGKLAALEELSVSLPALLSIAGELPKLVKLTHLRVEFGDEEGGLELPEEIARLPKLRVLAVAFLKLARLPVELGALRELVELDVAGNRLEELASIVARLPKLQRLSFSDNPLGRNEKKTLDAMMRVSPGKRAALLGAPIAKPGKNQAHPTYLGQAVSINNSIMLMVGDAATAAKWQGTDNGIDGGTDGSDWDKAFKAKWEGRSNMCVPVAFAGGSLLNLDVGGMGGIVDVFRVRDGIVLVEGAFEEHERKHVDFLAYVTEAASKKAKKAGSFVVASGAVAFVPAPSSGKRITKNLGKLGAHGAKSFSTGNEEAVVAKLDNGTYAVWREGEVERSWGEAARVLLVRT